jgi:hypothetical protein
MRMARKPDRRTSPRWQVVFGIGGQVEGLSVSLVDISDGGFLVRTRGSFTVGERRQVQFRAANGPNWAVTVAARIVHVYTLPWLLEEESMFVGFAFDEDESPEHRAAVLRLVDQRGGTGPAAR